ncbi:LysR substrate-binding domain-containing protein, partial [Escherichia coli]|uniref:LysR substrate-binding domain-containing protein n=1 Tax=Escherichia coli TaxID=562 RepID=UPI0032E3F6FB
GVQTTLRINNSRQVIQGVRSGELSLGFIESPDVPGDIRSVRVVADSLVVVVAPANPWAARTEPLTLKELAATPLVEREEGSGTRAVLDDAAGRNRAAPIAELNSNSAICTSAMAGLGPAVLSKLQVQGPVRAGRLVQVPVAGLALERELRAIWFGTSYPPGAARDLLNIAVRPTAVL